MSEIALYRKYRPKNFKEVLGQDHIVKVLLGSISLGKISHAYLFAGSRGTGKTSIARIFAETIGCSQNDLYEIDAASNRGIDEVRAIRDSVSTLPFESKYKVYIIDEAHMLTKDAFNAFLKTLEEPPPYVVFILATTEMEKLPETVVSRCQLFTFKQPSQSVLKEVVDRVAKKEGFNLDKSAADLIALLGDGSFRDAIGTLQKVISASRDKKVSVEEVATITGAPKRELVNELISAIAEKNLDRGLSAVRKADIQNVDMQTYIKLILEKLRFVILLRISKDMEPMIKESMSKEDFEYLKKLSKEDSNINSDSLLQMLDAYDNTRRAYIPMLPLELALIKIIQSDKFL